MNGAGLPQAHQLLGDGAGGLGLGKGGGDAPVLDKARNQVRQHRIAMLELAAELGGAFQVSHKASPVTASL